MLVNAWFTDESNLGCVRQNCPTSVLDRVLYSCWTSCRQPALQPFVFPLSNQFRHRSFPAIFLFLEYLNSRVQTVRCKLVYQTSLLIAPSNLIRHLASHSLIFASLRFLLKATIPFLFRSVSRQSLLKINQVAINQSSMFVILLSYDNAFAP